jgi:hypothetical protein
MFEKLILSLYAGTLFSIVFLVAPVLLRPKRTKTLRVDFMGGFSGGFTSLRFLCFCFIFLLADEKYIPSCLWLVWR